MTDPIRKTLLAVAAGLMAVAAPLASAQAAQQNSPQTQRQIQAQTQTHGRGQQQGQNDRRDERRDDRQDNRYGRWDSSWGARPPAPPRHFTRTADWHRHVRACQQRYRSYDARTDRYTVRRGQTAICRL